MNTPDNNISDIPGVQKVLVQAGMDSGGVTLNLKYINMNLILEFLINPAQSGLF